MNEEVRITDEEALSIVVGNEIYMSKTAFSKVSDLPLLIKTLLINGRGIDLNKLIDF
jgi:putative ABC transport system permease protein